MREYGEHAVTAVTEATRTLAMLNAQADSVRDELAWLRGNLAEVHRDTSGMRVAELLEANEQLVIAALRANAIAETAVSNLAELTRSSHRDTLAPPPGTSHDTPVEDPALRDLREANEQLVIATLSARVLTCIPSTLEEAIDSERRSNLAKGVRPGNARAL